MAKDKREKRKPTGDYPVGYCRTPVATRTKKGEPSLNRAGRPKGSRNTKTIVLEVLNQPVEIWDGKRSRKITTREALIRKITVDALQGKSGAMKNAMLLLRLFPEDDSSAQPALTPEDRDALRDLQSYIAAKKSRDSNS